MLLVSVEQREMGVLMNVHKEMSSGAESVPKVVGSVNKERWVFQ